MKRLVICRSPTAVHVFAGQRGDGTWTVASDDPRVAELAHDHPWIDGVVRIEQPEPFYVVSRDVLRVLQQVNASLASCLPPESDLPPGILAWTKNVEGGMTSQRIQDLLLLIRSYRGLLIGRTFSELRLMADADHAWEDQVLESVAAGLGIHCVRTATSLWAGWTRAWRERLRPVAMSAYILATVLRHGGGRRTPRAAESALAGAVVFQLASSRRKHVENVRPLMLQLLAQGAKVTALCWTAGERLQRRTAKTELQAAGVNALALEQWLGFTGLMRALGRAVGLGQSILRGVAGTAAWQQLRYEDVSLAPLLAPSVRHFVIAELPWRLCYVEAFTRCCGHARPAAFKPWAGPESFEGGSALRTLRRSGSPLTFHYWLGAAMEWPYADGAGALDLFLAKGPHEARLAAREYELPDHAIAIVGQPRFAPPPSQSGRVPARRRLGLPEEGGLVVGYDPNGILRGILSLREQTEITAALLRLCRHHDSIQLIVKPHPSYSIEHLRPMLLAGGRQVRILLRTASVEDFLDASDVFVTKFSTLILEAALRGRPSVSVLLDGEDRFKVYGDLPDVVRSIPEFEGLLAGLVTQSGRLAEWTAAQARKREELLPQFYHVTGTSPSELAAAEILRRLPEGQRTAA